MKNIKFAIFLLVSLVLVTAPVAAAPKGTGGDLDKPRTTYFSVEYLYLNPNIAGGEDYDNTAIMGKVGMVMVPHLAVEGFLALGIGSDKWTSENGCDSEEVSTDRIIGVQARGFVDLTPKFNIHGVIGYNIVTASRTISGAESCYGYAWSETTDDDEAAITIGFGAELQLNSSSAIIANYQMFYDDTYAGLDLQIPGYSVGYKRSF